MFFEDMKIVLTFVVLAVVSALIRFKTFTSMCIDAALAFIMGYTIYLALGYFMMSGEVRAGISGIVVLFSRPLYDLINRIIATKLEKWLEKKID